MSWHQIADSVCVRCDRIRYVLPRPFVRRDALVAKGAGNARCGSVIA
jgi:hypothetical protein